MIDSLSGLFDVLVLCAGLVVIVWVGLHSSRRSGNGSPAAAVIGMLVWLVALGFTLYWSLADVPRPSRRPHGGGRKFVGGIAIGAHAWVVVLAGSAE